VLTKSIQGLMFLPAILLYVVYRRQLRLLLTNKWFYMDLAITLFITGGYYLLREHYNPGYLQAVWENELGGRYLQPLEENNYGYAYYPRQLKDWLFKPWWWVSLPGILAGYFSRDLLQRRLTIYASLLSLVYLLLISLSQTRLEWYAVPLYPFLCFLVAMLLYRVLTFLQGLDNRSISRAIIGFIFLALVFVVPYIKIGRKVYNPTEYEWDQELYPISYVLQDAYRGKRPLNNYKVCYRGYRTHLLFYIKALNQQGRPVNFSDPASLRPGDNVIACERDVKQQIEARYSYQLEKEFYNVRFYKILGVKSVF
jgi:hypothetical protein